MATLQEDVTEPTVRRMPLERVFVSVCMLCLRPIAYSPSLKMLVIAEKAHKCLAPPGVCEIWKSAVESTSEGLWRNLSRPNKSVAGITKQK